jgi:CubicO group peptidase (beta-lactamase class C family)/GNAT superfamily N-acetyltransferase
VTKRAATRSSMLNGLEACSVSLGTVPVVHGALIVVVEDGTITSVTSDVLVPWWSITKSAIAAAALRLVEAGEFTLDAPLPARPYTLRQLLQHRTGLRDYGPLGAYHDAVARGDPPWDDARLMREVQAEDLLFEPGTGFSYSNVGYLIVRRRIEEVTRMSLAQALDSLVFAPLGLRARIESALTVSSVSCIVAGYDPGWVFHGLLVSPLADAALFVDRLLTGRLLGPALLRELRGEFSLGGRVPQRPWLAPAYALGLMTGVGAHGAQYAGHTGHGPGSTIAVYQAVDRIPRRTAAVFASTDDEGSVEQLTMDLAYGTDSTRLPHIPWPGELRVAERAVTDADYGQLWRLHVDAMRDYVAATYGWVDEVQERLFREGWQRKIAQRVLVDDVVVAAWLIERRPDGIFLSFVEVASSHQGRGIGTIIVRRVLSEARAARLPARLGVMRSNPRARRLYERLGSSVEHETATHYSMIAGE